MSWSVDAWLGSGTTDRLLRMPHDWGRAMCWVDGRTVALWGYGEGEDPLPAALLVDVTTGEVARWFAGPGGGAFFHLDGLLVESDHLDERVAVWDLATGERLLRRAGAAITHHHPGRDQLVRLEGGALRRVRLTGAVRDPNSGLQLYLGIDGSGSVWLQRPEDVDRSPPIDR